MSLRSIEGLFDYLYGCPQGPLQDCYVVDHKYYSGDSYKTVVYGLDAVMEIIKDDYVDETEAELPITKEELLTQLNIDKDGKSVDFAVIKYEIGSYEQIEVFRLYDHRLVDFIRDVIKAIQRTQ